MSSPAAGAFVEDDFAFQQLPPSPPSARRVDPAVARNEAAQIVATAQVEAEQIREQARLQGHAEGYEAGRADAATQYAPAVQALAAVLGEAQAERERVTILVHPQDLPIVREAVDGLIQQLGGIEHLEVQEERRVQRGGAIVRSVTG